MPLVHTFVGQFVFAQPKLTCSQGRCEGSNLGSGQRLESLVFSSEFEVLISIKFVWVLHFFENTLSIFELFKNQLFGERVS